MIHLPAISMKFYAFFF